MEIEVRSDSVIIDGYVNAVGRDSRPMRDRKTGKRYVEQIVPGAFRRALSRNEVKLLLNHEETRLLGSTEKNLELYEDSIGLHARAVVTDPEVVQKARDRKLRGWSFGFYEHDASEETINGGMERRFVEELELVEVSVIDERKIPCYEGTSIEARAEGKALIIPEPMETAMNYTTGRQAQRQDYTKYRERIGRLEEKGNGK